MMRFIKPFIFGILGAAGALMFELVFSNLYFIFSGQDISFSYFEKATFFLVLAVAIEEFFKYLMLRNLYRLQNQKGWLTIIFFGLGFASLEVVFTLLNMSISQNLSYFLASLLKVVLLHLITSAIIGYFVFSEKNNPLISAVKALVIASALHLLYNLTVIYN